MHIRVLGLNHKTAPIEIREKVSFSSDKLDRALLALKGARAIKENLILSTCNRTELYAVIDDGMAVRDPLGYFLADFHGLDHATLSQYLYEKSDKDAVNHLFEVVSSLDSMIVGETQIFGQVKDAYFKARSLHTLGKTLDFIFEEAIRVGRVFRRRAFSQGRTQGCYRFFPQRATPMNARLWPSEVQPTIFQVNRLDGQHSAIIVP